MTDSLAGRGLDLTAIEARLDAATPGPWKAGFGEPGVTSGVQERNPGWHAVTVRAAPWAFGAVGAIAESEADAAFISHAPADVAGLLAACRTLREALQEALDATTKGPVKWLVPYKHDASFHAWLERAVGVLAQTQDPGTQKTVGGDPSS